MNAERLLARFLRYVQIDTTVRDDAGTYPSSPGQIELGRMLAEELRTMGASDVEQDGHGIVMATLPATVSQAVDTIAFNAHLDTSPETSGANVRPQVIRKYGGGDIALPGDAAKVIRVAANPELRSLVGKTIITTDGTTLLGSDDKSGVAVIMEAANYLLEHPELPRGRVRVCFTCDEEIGHGVDHVDLTKLGAKVCYTLDGSAAGEIDTETFSADMAKVTVHGVNIHPSIAKGRMVNAVRVAADFVDRLPRGERSPETTDERAGFLHPYVVEGGVADVRLKILLRDFETAMLAEHADLLRRAAVESEREFPGSKIEIEIVEQYRNMARGSGARAACGGVCGAGVCESGAAVQADDRSRRDRRLAVHRAGPAHAEPFDRRAQPALAAGVDVSGRDGGGGGVGGGIGAGVGERREIVNDKGRSPNDETRTNDGSVLAVVVSVEAAH